jgi:hypothetical protein
MPAAISWDQTLVSAALSLVVAWWAYRAAARVLRRQELLRRLRARRDALEQVLVQVEGSVREYLESGNDDDYPQREMVELERCALQAQVYFLRDLAMQKALRDICYPNRYTQAMEAIRRAIEAIDTDIRSGRSRAAED